MRGVRPLRPALVFTAFETLMPIVGFFVGSFAGARFAVAATLAGGLVLLGVGFFALREIFEDEDETEGLSFGSWRSAAAAGIGVSLDELAVGFPLGTARLPLGLLLAALAMQTFVVTFGGIAVGRRVRAALGRRAARLAGIVAGVAFCALGVSLVIEAAARSRA